VNFLLKCNKKRSIEILFRPLLSAFVKRIFAIEAWDLLDFGQADIRNPLSLLAYCLLLLKQRTSLIWLN